MALFAFICLQVMDILTTLLCLHHGVQEANPLIRAALANSADPRMALGIPKVLAIALATSSVVLAPQKAAAESECGVLVFVAWNLASAWAAR